MVLGLTHVLATQEYLLPWQEFVKSLSETELKQMLILFGNTTCLSREYTIYVSDTLKTVLKNICKCMHLHIFSNVLLRKIFYAEHRKAS